MKDSLPVRMALFVQNILVFGKPPGATPAHVTGLPDPQQVREQVIDSVRQARVNCHVRALETERRLAALVKKREEAATARAAQVIAGIPEKVRIETELWKADPGRRPYQTAIMDVQNKATKPRASEIRYETLTECSNGEEYQPPRPELLGAAKIVFNFCHEAGLTPTVVFHPGGKLPGVYPHFTICIQWIMPLDQ